jgi:ribosomal protein L37AE/L43A
LIKGVDILKDKSLSEEYLEPKIITVKRKPMKCPVCGFETVATILYGEPIYSPQLCKQMEERTVTLGGCCIYPRKPRWECTKCKTKFSRDTEFYIDEED